MVKFIEAYPDDCNLPSHSLSFTQVGQRIRIWNVPRPHPDFPNVAFTHDILSIGRVKDTVKWNEIEELWNPEQYSETPLILLVRDPRDVIVSFYYQKAYRQPWHNTFRPQMNYDAAFEKNIDEFVHHDTYGIKRAVACMNVWADIPFRIYYEDMHKDIRHEMARLLYYMNITDIDEERFEKAIKESSFDAMRLAEDERTKDYPPGPEEAHKIRKGKVGKYKDELSKDTIQFIDEYLKDNLHSSYGRYFGILDNR
jgi:hypothetical protein